MTDISSVNAIEITAKDSTAAAFDSIDQRMQKTSASANDLNASFRAGVATQTAAVDSMRALSAQTQALVNQYDPLGAKLRSLQSDLARLNSEVSRGAGRGQEGAIDATYAAINAQIAQTQALMGGVGAAGSAGFGAMAAAANEAAFMTTRAKTEVVVLAHEMLTGRFSRIPGSLMVLAQGLREGVLSLLAWVAPIAAVVAGLGLWAYAAAAAAKANEAIDNALKSTGNFAGMTRDSIRSMAESVSDAGTLTFGAAQKIITALAATGRYGADNINELARLTENYAAVTGQAADKTEAKLAQMFEDPTKASEKLNQQYHYLSIAQLEHIKELQDAGQMQEAMNVAIKALDDALPKHAQNISTVASAWQSVKKWASEAIDAIGNFKIAPDTSSLDSQIAATQAALQTHVGVFGISQADHDRMVEQLKLLEQEKLQLAAIANQKGVEAQKNAELQATNKLLEQSDAARVDHITRQIDRLKSEHDALIANGASQVYYQSELTKLEKERASILNKGAPKAAADDRAQQLSLAIGQERTAFESEKTVFANSERTLADYHSKMGLSDSDFYAGRAAARAQFMSAEKTQYEAQITALVNYVNRNSKEWDKTQAEMAKVEAAHQKFLDQMGQQALDDTTAEAAAQRKYFDDLLKSINKTGDAAIASLDKQIAAQQLHNQEIGKTKAQIDALRQAQTEAATAQLETEAQAIQNLLDQNVLTGKYIDIYTAYLQKLQEEIDKRHQLAALQGNGAVAQAEADAQKKASQEATRAWTQASNSIENSLISAFDSWATGAKNIGAQLKNDLLRMFDSLVLRPTLQMLLAGGALSPGGASASGGGGGLLSTGSSLLSGAGTVASWLGLDTGAFGAAATAGFSAGLDTLGIALSAGADAVGGFSAVLGAAIPVIGWVAAAGALIYSIFGKSGGGPKQSGFASSIPGFAANFPNETTQSSQMDTLLAGQQSTYAATLAAVGGTGTAQFGNWWDTDPQGTASNRVAASATVNGKVVYNASDQNLGRDQAALQADIALQAQRALLAALQASNVPQAIANILDSVVPKNATADQITQVIALATAYGDLTKLMAANPATDAAKAIAAQSNTVAAAFQAQGAALGTLLSTYDGSAKATQALDTASQAYYASLVALLAQIQQVKSAIDTMFQGTIRSMTLQTLDPQAKYAYYQNEAKNLTAQALASTDPTQIQNLMSQVNQDFSSAFGLLSPQQQQQMLTSFTTSINNIDKQITTHLTGIGTTATNTADAQFAKIQTAINDLVAQMKANTNTDSTTAATNAAAAATNLQAAKTPVTINLNLSGGTATEVGGG